MPAAQAADPAAVVIAVDPVPPAATEADPAAAVADHIAAVLIGNVVIVAETVAADVPT